MFPLFFLFFVACGTSEWEKKLLPQGEVSTHVEQSMRGVGGFDPPEDAHPSPLVNWLVQQRILFCLYVCQIGRAHV